MGFSAWINSRRDSRMIKFLLRLYRNRKGATLIEAAFVLPVFLFMVFAIIEMGLIFFYAFVMEAAMYDTTRHSKIAEDPASQVEEVRRLIAERSHGLIPAEEIVITTDLQVNFAENWQNAEPENCLDPVTGEVLGACPCTGGQEHDDRNGDGLCNIGPPPLELGAQGNLVSFISFYKKPIYTPFMEGLVNQSNGRYLISSGTMIRNEPSLAAKN